MAAMIKLKGSELDEIVSRAEGGVSIHYYKGAIPVPPSALHNVQKHLTDQLDASIGKHHSLLDGIVLGYKNVKVTGDLGTIRNDTSDVTFDVQMDVYLFQPKVGDVLSGVINKKSDTHLSVLVHKMFNVVIPRPAELFSETWVGTKLREGQRVTFQIMVLDLFGVLPYIRGVLRDESDLPPIIDELDMGVVDFSKINKTPNNINKKKNVNNSSVNNSYGKFAEKTENKISSTPKIVNGKKSKGEHYESDISSSCNNKDLMEILTQRQANLDSDSEALGLLKCENESKIMSSSSRNNKNKNNVSTEQQSSSDSDSDLEANKLESESKNPSNKNMKRQSSSESDSDLETNKSKSKKTKPLKNNLTFKSNVSSHNSKNINNVSTKQQSSSDSDSDSEANKLNSKSKNPLCSLNTKNVNNVSTKQQSSSDSDSDSEANKRAMIKAVLKTEETDSDSSEEESKTGKQNESSEKKSLVELLLSRTRESLVNSKCDDDSSSSEDERVEIKAAQKRKLSDLDTSSEKVPIKKTRRKVMKTR